LLIEGVAHLLVLHFSVLFRGLQTVEVVDNTQLTRRLFAALFHTNQNCLTSDECFVSAFIWEALSASLDTTRIQRGLLFLEESLGDAERNPFDDRTERSKAFDGRACSFPQARAQFVYAERRSYCSSKGVGV
jgi:hypothetical protein